MRADAFGAVRAAAARGPLVILSALLLVAVLVIAHAIAPFLFQRVTLQNELAVQLKATSGLRILTRRTRFVLLPRPRVEADEVRIDDGSGAVVLDADGLTGDVRLLPLVVGRIELSSVTLHRPRIAVDLAAAPFSATSTIGLVFGSRRSGDAASQRLGALALDGGTLRLSRGDGAPLVFTDIDALIDWSSLDSAASLSGSLGLGDARVELSLWLGHPLDLLRGESSDAVLHGHTPSLDVVAKGLLTGSAAHSPFGFSGHVAASAAALGGLLASAMPGLTLPAPFADAALDGDARITADGDGLATLDLQKLAFRADGNDWEGTLAVRRGPRPLVSATLATDRLLLAPFTAGLPAPLDANRRWSRAPLPALRIGDVDLDLRVSAGHLVQKPFTIEDAALAVISRSGRLDIALIDGRLAGGALKGRLSLGSAAADPSSLGFDPPAVDMRGSLSLAGGDASALSWDVTGRQLATGTLSLSLSLESRGGDAASLVSHLSGSAKVSLADGDVAGLGSAGGRAPVAKLDASARIVDGVAILADAAMSGPGPSLSGGGMVDLRSRTLDLRASSVDPAENASAGAKGQVTADPARQGTALTVRGPLDDPVAAREPLSRQR